MERRQRNRLLCADLVRVSVPSPEGGWRTLIVNLENLSEEGACLLSDEPIDPNSPITLSFSGGPLNGRVMHCSFSSLGWIVGVRFNPGTKWDAARMPPAHLLDPAALATDPGTPILTKPAIPPALRETLACLFLNQAVDAEEPGNKDGCPDEDG